MSETTPDENGLLYIQDPLLEGFRVALKTRLGGAVRDVTIGAAETGPRWVNLWPLDPRVHDWTLGGPTASTLTFQATSVGLDAQDAWKLGSQVRYLLGKNRHGSFRLPVEVDGYHVIDLTFTGGSGDSAAGVGTWHETFSVLYHQNRASEPF